MNGHCLCNAVQVTIADPTDVGVCHCRTCRRWAGGPAFVIDCDEDQLEVTGGEHVREYESSDWAVRAFCTICGTHLYYRLKESGLHTLGAGLFADTPDMRVTRQIFIDEKPDYYSLSNDTPCLTGQEVFAAYTNPS